jgi:hypothetical protein
MTDGEKLGTARLSAGLALTGIAFFLCLSLLLYGAIRVADVLGAWVAKLEAGL